MARFIIRRLLGMIPFILLVSFTVFVLIKLPPGDFVSNYAANLSASGETVNEATLLQMRQDFGLNQPFLVQYWHWIWGVLHLTHPLISLEIEKNRWAMGAIPERIA